MGRMAEQDKYAEFALRLKIGKGLKNKSLHVGISFFVLFTLLSATETHPHVDSPCIQTSRTRGR